MFVNGGGGAGGDEGLKGDAFEERYVWFRERNSVTSL